MNDEESDINIQNYKKKLKIKTKFNLKIKNKFLYKNKKIIRINTSIIICIFILFIYILFYLNYIKNKINIKNIIINKINNISNNKRTFFFLENQEELPYCKNYGILIYDYFKEGKFDNNAGNIGDYIQSLAALQFLPKNCIPFFVDRDTIKIYYGPKIKVIMNGFYSLNEGNNANSEQIIPIYTSIHISNNYINSDTVNNLQKYKPIGCRDNKTLKLLMNKGIDAYFSGCLTTTLDIDYGVDDSKRNDEIIFVDYKFGNFDKADQYLYSLKAYNFSKIINITHHFNLTDEHLNRFKIAKNLLDRYARAKLVVTTRLYAALPCLALHTPVILINKNYDSDRFLGLYELLNSIGENSEGKFEIRVNLNEKGLVYNSDKYLQYANKLKESLKNILI